LRFELDLSDSYAGIRGEAQTDRAASGPLDHSSIVLRTYAPRGTWRFEWSGDLIETDILPRTIASDMMAVRSMTLEGAGVAILPSFLAREDIESGKLAELLPEPGLPAINVFASFPHHRANLSKIKVLIAELQRVPAQAAVHIVAPHAHPRAGINAVCAWLP
jgi:DNA-binding transcriptional LysR family regulator